MILFHNANIYTPLGRQVTALAVDHDTFLALGTDSEILDSFSKPDHVIDLDGRTIWPGLTDAHLHLQHLAGSMAMIDCETDTLQACLSRVESETKDLPEDAWVRGHGWNQNKWIEGFGTAASLDHVTGNRPAYLTAKSLHAAWANSKALELAGINAQRPDPPSGLIQRDKNGVPTGILFEAGAMALVESVIPQPSQKQIESQINALIPILWGYGLVGIHDFDGMACWNALVSRHQKGKMDLRIRKNIPFDHLDSFVDAKLRTDFGNDWLHLGGVKLFADGALGPQTAAMLKPYQGADQRGILLLTKDEILEIGKFAVSHGIALTVHAIGDWANRVVLDAFEALREYERKKDLPHLKHRIEHVQILDALDLSRLAKLDIIASVQPVHAPSDMEMADKFLGYRTKHAYAYRSILESGAEVVFGSDAPVEPVNPFLGIHAAVTRQRLDGRPGSGGWHPEQRLSLEQSLEGFCRTPAVISNRGKRLGNIAPGYRADFIILEQDPFQRQPAELAEVKPAATFIGGNCVYQSDTLPFDLDPLS